MEQLDMDTLMLEVSAKKLERSLTGCAPSAKSDFEMRGIFRRVACLIEDVAEIKSELKKHALKNNLKKQFTNLGGSG